MLKRFLFAIVVVACASSAPLAAAPRQLHRAPFVAGLPDFPLLNAVTEPQTARLAVPGGKGIVHVVTGRDPQGTTVWWLLHKTPDGTTGISPLGMRDGTAGTLIAFQKLTLEPMSNATTILEVSVPSARNAVQYRWVVGDAATITLGQPLAKFDLVAQDGRKLRLADLKGPIVVLNSWATWCAPCVEELPALNSLVERYADRGVEFVAMLEPNRSEDLATFLRKHPFAYRQTIATSSSRRIFGHAFPQHVILDADGNVAHATTGGSDQVDRALSAVLDKLLAK